MIFIRDSFPVQDPHRSPWPGIPGPAPSGWTSPIQFYVLPLPMPWIVLTNQYNGESKGVSPRGQPKEHSVLGSGRGRISRGPRTWVWAIGSEPETGGEGTQASGHRPGQVVPQDSWTSSPPSISVPPAHTTPPWWWQQRWRGPPASELPTLLQPTSQGQLYSSHWPALGQEQHVAAQDKAEGCKFGVFSPRRDCHQDYYRRMSKPWDYHRNGAAWEQERLNLNSER